MESDDYPNMSEYFVQRNFILGDKVKVRFGKRWVKGTVVDRYKKNEEPYMLIRAGRRVNCSEDAPLDGFGIEAKVDNPGGTIFDYEPKNGSEIYHRTVDRAMTFEEKKNFDNMFF